MAQGRYTYTLDVENSRALRKLADFAKASDKATQRIEKDIRSQKKANVSLGSELLRLKRKYAEAQQAATKFGKHDDNRKHVEGLRKIKEQIGKVREEYAKGRRELVKFNLERRKGATQFSRPIGPAAPRRGFGGNTGRRAGVGRAFAGAGGGGGLMGSALAGGIAGISAALVTKAAQAFESLARATVSYANDAAIAAAETQKLQLALVGVLGSQDAAAGMETIKQVVKDFNVPFNTATAAFTRFAASAKATGVESDDISKSFKGLVAANKALGGSQEQANGILLAATQVFGKGKVSAEELRGQIGERLPGAVALFAKSMGITTAELDKRLEEGTVSVEEFVNFAGGLFEQFGDDAKKIGDSSAEAGARLDNNLKELQRNIGMFLQPLGAEFQKVFAEIVGYINTAITALANFLGIGTEGAIAKAERTVAREKAIFEKNRGDAFNDDGTLKPRQPGDKPRKNVRGGGSFRRASQAQRRMQEAQARLDELKGKREGTITKDNMVTAEDLINNRRGGGGGGGSKGPDLDKLAADNARRVAQEDSRQIMAADKQRFALLRQLREEDHRLSEAFATGAEKSQLSITNQLIARNEAIKDQLKDLNSQVDKAQRDLDAAVQRLNEATTPSDRLRAQGQVDVQRSRLTGAEVRRDQFSFEQGSFLRNAGRLAIAESTSGFRDQAANAKNEANALRERNRLMLEGFSPSQIDAQERTNEIERKRLEQIRGLNPELATYNEQLLAINETSQLAKDAVNELSAAQEANSSALAQYVQTAQEYVTNIHARMAEIAQVIEQSISDAIMGLVNGTMTASEAFQNFFQNIGKAFLQMAAQMISKLIVIKLLKGALGMFGGGGDRGAAPTGGFAGVANNVLDSILPKPEGFAKGGIVTAPTTALIGEGGMNEAVVPLPNGKAIPVDMGKNAGNSVQTNITVNVDQGGNAQTEMTGDQAGKLGQAIDVAVKRVIMEERRSGGLLANGRR